jgi:hypothetical protein
MGVDRTDYLMFAADVGFDDSDFDRCQAEIEGAPGAAFDMIRDGMSGQYCLAGKVIAKSEPYEGFEMAKIAALEFDREGLARTVSEKLGRAVMPDDFSLILFSHFS